MFLQDVVSEKTIVTDVKSRGKNDILKEMVSVLAGNGVLTDKNAFYDAVIERENLESTAIGDEIAIPHAKHDSVKKIFCCLGRIKEGAEFNALDGKPVKVFFLVASPPEMNREYIQIVAKAARLLKSGIMKQEILKAVSAKDAMKIIVDFDRILQQSVEVKTKEGRIIHKDI
ncbi:MAG: PTS sugar transporter subunit IIA [bacterium]